MQKKLEEALAQRILVLDGAMGTQIQLRKLTEADYRGTRFADWPRDVQGNNELLSLTRPDIIAQIHRDYLEAGADILETNTFNAQRISMADYGMEELSYELNVASARIARDQACEQPRVPFGLFRGIGGGVYRADSGLGGRRGRCTLG